MRRSLATRLSLRFLLLFAGLSLAAYAFTYLSLSANLMRRADAELAKDAEEILYIEKSRGIDAAAAEIWEEGEEDGPANIFYRLYHPERGLFASSDLDSWQGLSAFAPLPPGTGPRLETLRVSGKPAAIRSITIRLNDNSQLQIGTLLHDDRELLAHVFSSFSLAFAITVICSALISFVMVRRAMAGVERIRLKAQRISRGDFSGRVEAGDEGEEIENLAAAFNLMQERIEILIRELQEVSNNIAHDLRSPITRIRGLAETTLTGAQQIEDYREMAGSVIEESDRLVSMINTMLDIAETDAGLRVIPRSPVDMARLLDDMAELFEPVAEDRAVTLTRSIHCPLVIAGDRGRLQRALANLLDNAIKYTPAGGTVHLDCSIDGDQVVIRIRDTGVGIPESEQQRIFQRFVRLDQSRSTPGTGLGLSLVHAIITAHGGSVRVESQPGTGSTFIVYLPRYQD